MPYSRVQAVITNNPRLTWIGAAFGVVLLLWVRAPDAFATPQFYAEDANVFWISWRNLGVASFWTTYSGYLHLYPRLGAALSYPLPYDLHPAAFLVFATVGYAWTAITITTARLPTALGLSLALSMMLVPHWGEIWGSLVNVQWIMACALPVIVSTRRPDQSCARINQTVFVVVAGLTGPFSAIILPLWLARTVRAFRSRCNYGLTLSALGMCAGAIQLLFVLTQPAQPYPADGDLISSIALALVRRSGLDSLTWFGGMVMHSPEYDEAVAGRFDLVAEDLEAAADAEACDLAFDQPLRRLPQGTLGFANADRRGAALGLAGLHQQLAEEMRFSRTAPPERPLVARGREQRLKDLCGGNFQDGQ